MRDGLVEEIACEPEENEAYRNCEPEEVTRHLDLVCDCAKTHREDARLHSLGHRTLERILPS